MSNDSYPENFLQLEPSDRDLLERIITDRLAPEESIDDVFGGADFLARRRAELLGYNPGADDFLYVLSLFTWYPFKPDLPSSAEAYLVESRSRIFKGVSNGDFGSLEYIPSRILTLSFLELTMRQLGDPNQYLAALGLTAGA
jgi:hypothetical protein